MARPIFTYFCQFNSKLKSRTNETNGCIMGDLVQVVLGAKTECKTYMKHQRIENNDELHVVVVMSIK